MTAKKLIEHEKANWRTYADLAERCRSVPELLLKLDAYGKVWTRWDWVLFFKYLYVQNQRVSPSGWLSLNQLRQKPEETPEKKLADDMFDALDNGPALDKVLTDKAVVLSFVAYAGGLAGKPPSGVDAMPDAGFAEFVYSLLAHVFRKFPALWTMNWMFFRPRSGPLRGVRVHRLAGAVDLRRRPEYFASRAFLDDFVRKYYRRPLGAV